MKMNGRIRSGVAIFCAVLFLGAVVPAFSQSSSTIDNLSNTMDAFAESMARSLPFNASMGLNWSDAYIGRFFPSIPPRFGVGIVGGFTTMDISPLGSLLDTFSPGLSNDLFDWGGFPIPGAMVEARIGGFFLPFDVGVKIGYLPNFPGTFDVDYFLVGADIRYALLEGNIILPTISVGVGFNHLSGGVGRSLGNEFSVDYMDQYGSQTLRIGAPRLGVSWETTTLDFKAQVSRPILIITPYIGIGASLGWSRVAYGLDAEVRSTGDLDLAREVFKDYNINIEGQRLMSEHETFGVNFRAFGGVSFNLPFVRLDLTGLWDIRDNNFGATLGARFQI